MEPNIPTATPSPLPLPCSSSSLPCCDPWTNLCTAALLDEYESVFIKLGRGHLRPKDWEQVSLQLNRRLPHLSRTPQQCKAKIEKLKKHYRRERLKCNTSPSRTSRWPFYHKLRQLVGDPLPHGYAGIATAQTLSTTLQVEFSQKLSQGSDSRTSPAQTMHPAVENEFKDDVKASPEEGEEAVHPPASHQEKVNRKPSSIKNRHMASLGKDLKEGLHNFAAVIEKIERTKMELSMFLQMQRLEQDRQYAEMELERTRLLMRSQLDLAKLICARIAKKDCNGKDEKCRKRGREAGAPDAANCRMNNGEDSETMSIDGDGHIGQHEAELANSGNVTDHTLTGSESLLRDLRRHSLQIHNGEPNCSINSISNGCNESQSALQNCSRKVPMEITEKVVKEEAEENIRHEDPQLAQWETGIRIVNEAQYDNLSHIISNSRCLEGNMIELQNV